MTETQIYENIKQAISSAPRNSQTMEMHLQMIKYADHLKKVTTKEFCEGLDFVGQKSIAKMYATPDGGVAATYIDNGSIPIFVLRPSNPDGEMAVYTLSMCSEV